jgi:hypothetical protein
MFNTQIVPIKILVDTKTPNPEIVFGKIIGVSDNGESWIVILERAVNNYPFEISNVLSPNTFRNQSNVITIPKDSSLRTDSIEISDDHHLQILNKGGSKKRRHKRKSRKTRRIRRRKGRRTRR